MKPVKKYEQKRKSFQRKAIRLASKQESEIPFRSRIFWLGHTLYAILGIGALVLSYLELRPTCTLEPSQVLDAEDPFSQRFTLKNTSLYALEKIHFQCGIDLVSDGITSMKNFSIESGGPIAKLNPGDSYTVHCPIQGHAVFKWLTIYPKLVFRLPFGAHGCRAFPLKGEGLTPSGPYIWEYTSSPHDLCGPRSWLNRSLDLDNPDDQTWMTPDQDKEFLRRRRHSQ